MRPKKSSSQLCRTIFWRKQSSWAPTTKEIYETLYPLGLAASLLFALSAEQKDEPYTAKNFDKLIGNSPGFSDDLLKMHFKLYQGYVANSNKLLKMIRNLDESGNNRGPEFAGLKRMFGWEFDGMRLHEFYFENLGGQKPLPTTDPLYLRITEDFGSYDKWKDDFIATGLIRGIGWTVLYRDPLQGRLINTWINEHDLGHLAGATPILIMDVFEHAYITEYKLDRAAYIEAFFKNIDWSVASQRFQKTTL